MNMCVRTALAGALISLLLSSCGSGDGPRSYSVGGTVSGLVGSGLVLANSNGESLAVSASGPFMFQIPLAVGAPYHVSVASEPDTNPKQRCTVSNGDGTSTGAAITDVSVNCVGPFVYLPANDVDYNTDTASPVIYAFTMDVDTGALIAVSGSPFPTQAFGNVLEVDGSGHFAYSAVSGNSVYGYTIDQGTGVLAPLAGSPFQFGSGSMQLDPTGRFAYAGLLGLTTPQNAIAVSAVDTSTGALVPISDSPVAVDAGGPTSLSFSSDGRFLFTTSNAAIVNGANRTGEIYGFAIDSSTGGLTPLPGGPLVTADGSDGVILDPKGRFAYVGGDVAGGGTEIWAYVIDPASGALSPVSGSPFTVGSADISIDPEGRFLITAQSVFPYDPSVSQGGFWVYDIDAVTGALTQVAGSPFPSPIDPYSPPYFDPGGNFVYFISYPFNTSIIGYTISAASGSLTPIAGSPFATEAEGGPERMMTFDPSGRFVYIQTGEYKGPGSSLNMGTIDASTGAITFVADGDFPGNAVPGSFTIVAFN